MTRHQQAPSALVRAALGLVFAAAGAAALWHTRFVAGDSSSALRSAPVVDAVSIGTFAAGSTVVLEGRISAANAVVEAGLVTLLRQQAVAVRKPGTDKYRFAWETRAVEARPLQIDTATGPLRIVNADYAWSDPPRHVPERPGVVVAGSERAVGFAVGDALTAHAVVVRDGQGAALRAVEVHGGDRAGYLRSRQASHWVGYVLGGVFTLIGLVLLGWSACALRRLAAGAATAGEGTT
jgi:hypothetical protein